MINIDRNQAAPECLAVEKLKPSSQNYRCGDVINRLEAIFFNKCYLCEQKTPTGINVEHFIPHRKNRDLMFDWDSLYFVCPHCNNIKGDKHDNILNCTEIQPIITEVIKFSINPFPNEIAYIQALNGSEIVINTANLLDKIYNSPNSTPLKKLESANLRNQLSKELNEFTRYTVEYAYENFPSKKQDLKTIIITHLQKDSPFSAFKIWQVKTSNFLSKEFADHI